MGEERDLPQERKSLEDFVEKDGVDFNYPIVNSLRAGLLERNARKQDSDLHCPYCKINLPYTELTVLPASSDDMMDLSWKQKYYCTICDEDFYKNQSK